MDDWTRQTQTRLFRFIFRLQQKRWPEAWEQALGLALVDGTLKVERIPDANELRRVHYAAHGVKAALGRLEGTNL
ncbi:MAG: hypothetical protein BroJett011_03790 [Chloroflexota bacterium]|nr:MAG: hypothetical protein BroJett011_03790 [Chloroflexota bacterium]